MVLRKLVVALVLMLLMVAVRSISAQAGDGVAGKTITFRVAFLKNAPLQVASLTIHGKAVPLDTPVQLESAWLDDVALTVTNTSPKTLTYALGGMGLPAISLVQTMDGVKFERREGAGGEFAISLTAGVTPAFMLHRKDGTSAPTPQVPSIAIAPGETVTLHVDVANVRPGDSAKVNALLPESSEARFMLSILWYADDTSFYGGKYQKVSDFNQRKLEPISAAEFQR